MTLFNPKPTDTIDMKSKIMDLAPLGQENYCIWFVNNVFEVWEIPLFGGEPAIVGVANTLSLAIKIGKNLT